MKALQTSRRKEKIGVRMEIDGELSLDLKGLVPRLMVGRATKGVEQFILKLMEPNFRRMGRALTEFLDSKK